MKVIHARNVNDAYYMGLNKLLAQGVKSPSRAGDVIRMAEPVTTMYDRPWERVLFCEERDANPFFHVLETIWMLSGSADLALPVYLVPRMADYSLDKKTNKATYGYRWRRHFRYDQLAILIAHLKKNMTSRRAYLGMWDPSEDLLNVDTALDVPCNLGAKFAIRYRAEISGVPVDAALDMFVFNRSNDMVMGGYGANAVHMSFLQEYIASSLGVGIGTYEQISCDFHAYSRDAEKFPKADGYQRSDPYRLGLVSPMPLDGCADGSFISDCERFVANCLTAPSQHYETNFFQYVVTTMMKAIRSHKEKDAAKAMYYANDIGAEDWRLAAQQWLKRRAK